MGSEIRQQSETEEPVLERLLAGGSRIVFAAGDALPANGSVYCPVDGVAIVSVRGDDSAIQVGFAVPGDLIFLQRSVTADFPPMSAIVLRGGRFRVFSADEIKRLALVDDRLDRALKHHAMAANARFLEEAVAAATLNLQRRVARWILSARAVLGSDILPVTHQFVAAALGVRRSGVTVALHGLEGDRLIRSRRVRIEVLDATRLRRLAEGAPSSERADAARAVIAPVPVA